MAHLLVEFRAAAMRRYAKVLAILLASVGVVLALAWLQILPLRLQTSEKLFRSFAPGTEITLHPRKDAYFLGENILLDYGVSYDGVGALDVWGRGGLRTSDCYVTATDVTGKLVPPSTLPEDDHGSGGPILRRGPYNSVVFTVPLMRYCRFEKPGTYRIRVAFDLGWSEGDYATWRVPPVPNNDPRWVETTIELNMPDAAQAQEIVERVHRLTIDEKDRGDLWIKRTKAEDYFCLQYAVYVPILETLITGTNGNRSALIGVAHTPTPEATGALFRLLEQPDADFVRSVTAALCDRLPDPQGFTRKDRKNPIDVPDSDPASVKRSWRSEFTQPARQFARKLLTDENATSLRFGAYILEAVGTEDDMPALIVAMNQLVPRAEAAAPSIADGQIFPEGQAWRELAYAIEAIVRRRAEPIADPQAPGEIIHYVVAIKQRDDYRPAGWEGRFADWIEHGTPVVSEVVLFNAPGPLPESLRKKYQQGVRKLIASARETRVIHRAVNLGLEVQMPIDEILGMLVERWDSDEWEMYRHISWCLRDLLATGKHVDFFGDCTRVPEAEELAGIKTEWARFLKQNGPALRQGRRFKLFDPKTAKLFT